MITTGHPEPARAAPEAAEAGADVLAALGAVPAFSRLSPEALARVAGVSVLGDYEPGETLFTMGQADDALYGVVRGEARMTRADGERGDITVETVTAGGWIGLVAFALEDASMNTAAVQAVGPLAVLTIDGHALRAQAGEDASLALALMRLCAEAARGRKRTLDPSARVYRYLLSLVRKTPGGAMIPEMPRHAALAEAAGVSDVEAAGAVAALISRRVAQRAYPGLAILDTAGLHRAAYD